METAVGLMEIFDEVLGGVVEGLKEEGGGMKDEMLVLITSDHGNMEDLSTRKHTSANVPALVIGNKDARAEFTRGMTDLTHVAPAIWRAVEKP